MVAGGTRLTALEMDGFFFSQEQIQPDKQRCKIPPTASPICLHPDKVIAARKKEQVTFSSQFSANIAQELPFSTKVIGAFSLLPAKQAQLTYFTWNSEQSNQIVITFDYPHLHWIQGAELKVKTNLSFPLQFPTAI